MTDGVVRMPRLSDSMTEATITAWLKRPGEPFTKGEALVEVETDKATVVYEAESDGILCEILVGVGETAELGSPIALLEGATAPRALEAPTSPPASSEASLGAAAPVTSSGSPGFGERPRATPVARRTALELGVALAGVVGTGPGGRIRQLDVLRAYDGRRATSSTASVGNEGGLKGRTTVVELSPTAQTIARRMMESRSTIPSFDVSMDVDLSPLVTLRRVPESEQRRPVPSLNDFVVRAVALALREHPALNASFTDGRIERHERINVGVAVAADDALLVPAILDADRKPLAVLAEEARDVAARARARQVTPDELAASTFTVSNLGMFGVRAFAAVINAPQVAILAVGGLRREPVEADGGIRFRDAVTLTLTSDHRAVYGADAARFLGRVRELLEHPLTLVL